MNVLANTLYFSSILASCCTAYHINRFLQTSFLEVPEYGYFSSMVVLNCCVVLFLLLNFLIPKSSQSLRVGVVSVELKEHQELVKVLSIASTCLFVEGFMYFYPALPAGGLVIWKLEESLLTQVLFHLIGFVCWVGIIGSFVDLGQNNTARATSPSKRPLFVPLLLLLLAGSTMTSARLAAVIVIGLACFFWPDSFKAEN